MESFPVYLPSNASTHIYPENTASDYRTRLSQPIRLEGEWEVGLESINYATKIDDSKEKSVIHLQYEVPKLVNDDDEFYHFRLSPDNEWKGTMGVSPVKFETDGTKIQSVIKSLNSLNEVILKDGEGKRKGDPLFYFAKHTNRNIYCYCYVDYFCLQLTNTLSYALGFKWKNTFSGKQKTYGASSGQPPKRPLTRKDYRVWFFSAPHLKLKNRLYFKYLDENLPKPSVKSVHKLWSERIEKYTGVKLKFKHGKMILFNSDNTLMLTFSNAFQEYFHQYYPVIGNGEKWSIDATNFNNAYPEASMFIDVYSQHELAISPTPRNVDRHLEFFPWNYESNKTLISYINSTVKNCLKQDLKKYYDAERHLFLLDIMYNFQIMFLIGLKLKVYFGKNLSHLLGLQNEFLPTAHDLQLRRYYNENKHDISILSYRPMVNIEKRQRQLFLLCSLTKPTAYGTNHLPILRDFVHENENKLSINEMRFEPIIYLPLKSNLIDCINIQVTDSEYNPVNINDCKTIVTLFFRKVKESAQTATIH